MKWLYVTSEPWPLTNGTALRVWHMTRTLAGLGEAVTVLTDDDRPLVDREYRSQGVAFVGCPRPATDSLSSGRWRLSPFHYSEAIAESVGRHCGGYDVVVLVGAHLLQYAASAASCDRTIVDMIDDPVLEVRRRLWLGANPRLWLRRLRLLLELRHNERGMADRAAFFTFVSAQDSGSFQRRHQQAKVVTSPNGIDLEYFRPGAGLAPAASGRPWVVFVGNFQHLPNRDAALFLAEKIAPCVWRKNPEVKFYLIGPHPPEALKAVASERLDVTGLVTDVRPYLAGAAAVLLPMRTGTGIKNKLLEAWAQGRPVVATTLACQGVPARHGENIFIGESAEALADLTWRLIQDESLGAQMGAAGRRCVEKDFAWGGIAAAFRQAVLDIPASEIKHAV